VAEQRFLGDERGRRARCYAFGQFANTPTDFGSYPRALQEIFLRAASQQTIAYCPAKWEAVAFLCEKTSGRSPEVTQISRQILVARKVPV
jgi:hypothetical protein